MQTWNAWTHHAHLPPGRALLALALLWFHWGCASNIQVPKTSSEDFQQEQKKQIELSFQKTMERAARVEAIAHTLALSSVELCGDRIAWTGGFFFLNAESTLGPYRDFVRKQFRLGEAFTVTGVNPGLPAARAGLKAHDRLLAVNTTPLKGKSWKEAETLLDQASDSGMRVVLEIERDGTPLTISYVAVRTCRFGLTVIPDDTVTAITDGKQIGVTTGMLRYVVSDNELAIVLGHELAHAILNHTSFAQQLRRGLLGKGALWHELVGKDLEIEADYVGLYLAARGGFNIAEASPFWRRMAADHPQAIQGSFGTSHPSTPERFVVLQATIDEIYRKQRQGLELLPERIGAKP